MLKRGSVDLSRNFYDRIQDIAYSLGFIDEKPPYGVRSIILSRETFLKTVDKYWEYVIKGFIAPGLDENNILNFRAHLTDIGKKMIIEEINPYSEEKYISDIYANELPIPFYSSPKIAVHLIPSTAFNPGQSYDLSISLYDIQPMKTTNFNHRYNIDGLLSYSKFRNDNRSFSYTQLYRNGIIEAVNSEMLWSGREEKIISITYIENVLIESVPTYMNVYEKLNVDLPIFLFVTLVDVKSYRIPGEKSWDLSKPYPIDRDIVMIPEIIIETIDFEPSLILKPIFDSIWNACGYKGSFNYDSEGKRKTK